MLNKVPPANSPLTPANLVHTIVTNVSKSQWICFVCWLINGKGMLGNCLDVMLMSWTIFHMPHFWRFRD